MLGLNKGKIMNLIESLKNLGLNEKEAKVYLALLQIGKSSAYSIAARSGLKKPTTYVILQQLIEKGFVYNVPRAKKQQFIAEDPEKCLANAKEKLEISQKQLPELLALKNKKEQKFNTAYFEGINGIRESYKRFFQLMKEKPIEQRKFVGFYAKVDTLETEIQKFFDEWNEKMLKLNIKRKAITTYNPLIAEKYLNKIALEKYKIEIKALNEEKYSSYISIETYDNYVHILSQRNLQAILIEDKDIANVIKQIFEMVWDLVDKDKEGYIKFSPDEN